MGRKIINCMPCHAVTPGTFRDKTMDNKLMYIPNDDKQNYPFCGSKLLIEKYEIPTIKIHKKCGNKTYKSNDHCPKEGREQRVVIKLVSKVL